MEANEIQDAVREKYGEIARTVKSGGSCCGPSCCSPTDPISGNLYGQAEIRQVPKEALEASLGCGNPTSLIDLHEGDRVLNLGSGGGIDALLSARRVGLSGKVYGLDMTDDMLALARENQQKAGVTNVEFLNGDIQAIPLPDESVDVIISNCVINLAPDKNAVLAEAFRVLTPGGRFAVSDVVVRGEVSPAVRRDMELWVGCIAGALEERDYVRKLADAGLEDIAIEAWRVYDAADTVASRGAASGQGPPRLKSRVPANSRAPSFAPPNRRRSHRRRVRLRPDYHDGPLPRRPHVGSGIRSDSVVSERDRSASCGRGAGIRRHRGAVRR